MKKTCDSCSGTGQISFFNGESRFLLSHEECPDCFGTGFLQDEDNDQKSEKPKKAQRSSD